MSAGYDKIQRLFANRAFLHVFTGIISFAAIFSRRPDALLNPQFWAEDGAVWYAQAYRLGFWSLLNQELSYYCTFQRLVACLSLVLPFSIVPLIFNLIAIGVKILVIQFFLSSRCDRLVKSLAIKLLIIFIYLALPNSWEIDANLTNSAQWHLALLGVLLIIAEPSRKTAWKIFDAVFMTLIVLTGPYGFFLFPLAIIRWWQKRERWTLWLLGIITLGCLLQGNSMLNYPRRPGIILGANFELFLRIVGGKVFTSAMIGQKGYGHLIDHNPWSGQILIAAALLGACLMIYALLKVSPELKILSAYGGMIFLTSLLSPAASATGAQWTALLIPGVGMRYDFVLSLAFFCVLIYFAANSASRLFRIVCSALLVLSLIGIVNDWKQPRYKDFKFQSYAREFNEAAPGTLVIIPLNPELQPPLEMTLIKK